MRWLLVAVGLMAPISGAAAQEFELPTLRGSQAFAPNAPDCCTSWGGFYVGGQVGFGVTSADFSTTTQDLVAHELRQLALENEQSVSSWQVLGQAHPSSAAYGFFVGYNVPWESLILGAEANYNRTNFLATAPISPLFINTSAAATPTMSISPAAPPCASRTYSRCGGAQDMRWVISCHSPRSELQSDGLISHARRR
jgi:opacity protein-like surface antigen